MGVVGFKKIILFHIPFIILIFVSKSCSQENDSTFIKKSDTVLAAELENAFQLDKNIFLENCTIKGNVLLIASESDEYYESDYDEKRIYSLEYKGSIFIKESIFLDTVVIYDVLFHEHIIFWDVTFNRFLGISSSSFSDTSDFTYDFKKNNQLFTAYFGPVSFEGCTFVENVNFSDLEVFGYFQLGNSIFMNYTDFQYSNFKSDVLFANNRFLNEVDFSGCKFSFGCSFTRTILTDAVFVDLDMTNIYFENCEFKNVVFEPLHIPKYSQMMFVDGLSTITFSKNPSSLIGLRHEFKENGFKEKARELTYALNIRENSIRLEEGKQFWFFFNYVLFDLTCQYGMNYGRPLALVFYLWLICSVVYTLFVIGIFKGGIIIEYNDKNDTKGRKSRHQIDRSYVYKDKFEKKSFLRPIINIIKLVSYPILFSLMSAFNIGFKDIHFGRWIKLLLTKEIELKPIDWVRTISGLQALLSFYFFVLFFLCYFSNPFE